MRASSQDETRMSYLYLLLHLLRHSQDAVATLRRSLDDLIRPPQHRRRDREAERLRGLEVDHQLELGGLLHRKIAWLGASKDLVHVHGCAPQYVWDARPICHEATSIDRLPPCVNRRQPALCRKIAHPPSLIHEIEVGS